MVDDVLHTNRAARHHRAPFANVSLSRHEERWRQSVRAQIKTARNDRFAEIA